MTGFFPPEYSKIWIRGQFINLDGTPMFGQVVFRPSPDVLLARASKRIIGGNAFTVNLDNDGRFAIQIPATDDPDIIPTGWTYNVTEPTRRTYNMVVPVDTPIFYAPGDTLNGQRVIDLIDIVPQPNGSGGTVQLNPVGPPGPPGPQGPAGANGAPGSNGANGAVGPAGPSVFTVVTNYGAVGNGTTDDTQALRNALAATPEGGICFVPPGRYAVTGPIVVPPNVTLEGSHGDTLYYTGNNMPCTIVPLAGFTGSAVVRMLGRTAGGYATSSVGQRLRNLTIDGRTAPAGTNGVELFGFVREVTLERVTVIKITNHGFNFTEDPAATAEQSRYPQSNRVIGCVAHDVGGAGFSITNMPDSTFIDCNAQGPGWVGFYIAGMPNSTFIGCRAEWSGSYGFYLTSGLWLTGQGSGGFNMLACITDSCNYDGVFIDGTGNAQMQLTNCIHRRDGRAGGTQYAGVRAATNMPVIVDNISVYPGVNDDGNGINRPWAGVSAANCTSFVVNSGYLHAATTAVNNGGNNGAFIVDSKVGRATGTSAAPTRVAPKASGVDAKVTVTGAKGGNAALTSVIAALVNLGFITDTTS